MSKAEITVKMLRSYVITLGILCTLVATVLVAYAKVHDVVLKQKKAVVTIYINNGNRQQIGTGTGFIIDADGIIATNYHVIASWLDERDNVLLISKAVLIS